MSHETTRHARHPAAARPMGLLLAALLALPLLAGGGDLLPEAEAGTPPLGKTYRDRVHKFSLRMLRGYEQIPLKTDEQTYLCKFADPKAKGSNRGTFDAEIAIMKIIEEGGKDDSPVTTGDEQGPMTPEKMRELWARANRPKDVWEATIGRLRLTEESKKKLTKYKEDFDEIESDDDEPVPGKLWQFEVEIPSYYQGRKPEGLHVTLAKFTRNKVSMVLYMTCGEDLGRGYATRFKQIAKSFEWHDDRAKDVERIDALDDVNISAKKRLQIEKSMVKGWDVIVSPKKNYIVIYNTKEGKNHRLAKVIAERIEKIREQIYEEQFPPAKPIKKVSIVRVCKDRREYIGYGGSPSSAGYWSSGDEELVFYDASASKSPDDDTLAVLYHEAFHQYIYYSVGDVAPHSWFNEGHGDYYAGAKYKGGRFTIEPFRWRVGRVKGAIVEGPRKCTEEKDEQGNVRKVWENKGYTPLKDLVNFTQREYYSYAGVSYAQGWALIYFLREIVPKKRKYREKWGHILDTYFDVLQREVNKGGRLVRGDEKEEPEGDGEDDDGRDGDDGKDGDDAPPAPEGDDGDAGGGDEDPVAQAMPRTRFRGRGGPEALKKAVEEAFEGVDWEEFEEAWIEATKRGK